MLTRQYSVIRQTLTHYLTHDRDRGHSWDAGTARRYPRVDILPGLKSGACAERKTFGQVVGSSSSLRCTGDRL